jgi:hypothetical protein
MLVITPPQAPQNTFWVSRCPARLENSVQNFPDSGGKQRPIVSTLVHAIIRLFGRSIWGVAHGFDCRDPASSFGEEGEYQFDRA